ncbi:MAG: hypothetical protein GX327_07295 [Epulopiscium sp.]|nr:hypothetical protein [Candidatus Epulonipiscium sp.]
MNNDKSKSYKKDIDLSHNFKNELKSEVSNKKSKADKANESNMNMEFIENYNPDDFE